MGILHGDNIQKESGAETWQGMGWGGGSEGRGRKTKTETENRPSLGYSVTQAKKSFLV